MSERILRNDTQHTVERSPLDRTITAGGVRIHYLEWGRAADPAVVFLHGGALTAHTWDAVCRALSVDHYCIAMDLRGHGDSDWAADGDYSLAAHARDLSALITGLPLERVVLVGMSLGGLVALTYAGAACAPGPAGLALVDTGTTEPHASGRERINALMDGPREFASVDDLIDRGLAFDPARSRERLRRSLLFNLRKTADGRWTWKYDPRFHRPFRDPAMTEAERARRATERVRDLWQAAANVACPVLVVRGDRSDMFLEADAEITARAFGRARVVTIPRAGHRVQGDNPSELAAALRHFLEHDASLHAPPSVP